MNEAVVVVHWPGKSVPACEEHRKQLQHLNAFLGMPLLAETPLTEPSDCPNCVNEKHRGD